MVTAPRGVNRTGRAVVIGAVLAIALAVLARPAAADEELPSPVNAEAKQQIDAGNKAFLSAQAKTDPEMQRRDFEEAILHYRAGAKVETRNHFTFYWNLGHAYRQLGDYRQADWFYNKFLEFAPQTLVLHREAAEKFITQMRDELARKATLMSPTDPAPSPIREPEPAHTDGAVAAAREVDVAPRWYRDRTGWALVGGGAVGLMVGGGFLVSGADLYDQAAGEDRQAVADELEDRARGRVIIGGVTGGVGVALLAAGVIKLAVTGHPHPSSSPVQVTFGPAWLSLQGRF